MQISKEGRSGWQEKWWVSHAVVRAAVAVQHVLVLLFWGGGNLCLCMDKQGFPLNTFLSTRWLTAEAHRCLARPNRLWDTATPSAQPQTACTLAHMVGSDAYIFNSPCWNSLLIALWTMQISSILSRESHKFTSLMKNLHFLLIFNGS